MSNHCLAVLIGVFATAGSDAASSSRDGLYLLNAELRDAVTESVPARQLSLGDEVPFAPLRSQIIPNDNWNRSFQLSIHLPFDERFKSANQHILVIGERVFRQGGSGTQGREQSSLHFTLNGKRAAEAVAVFLGADLKYRRHPGHQISLEWVPTKNEFQVGEPVTVKLRVRNAGKKAFAFEKGGRNRAARDNQFRFTAEHNGKPVIDIGSTNNFGGISVSRTVKPGEVFEDEVDLRKWFAFDKPGHYDILGSYYMAMQNPEADARGRTIWEEWVTNQFHLRVDAADPEE